jgi:hypothetical protein
MKEWIHLSKTLPDKKQSQVSKKRLKDEFEKLKPKILDKLHQQN